MAEFNPSAATTTNFTSKVPDFIVNSKALDVLQGKEIQYVYFPDAPQLFGYYLEISEIFSAANGMANWAVGLGYETDDLNLKIELDHVTGDGSETFDSIMWNHEVVKLICGDAFCEVKRQDEKIINMIPISPERIRIAKKNGRIMHYETWDGMKWVTIEKEKMLHSRNKKIGDANTGTSQISPSKKTIDAMNEALADERVIKHRDKALGIAYYKTDNVGKIAYANSQIEKGVANGEMIGLPEGTVKVEPYPSRSSEDRSNWISLLQNKFYQDFGVPRSIVSSDGVSEVGGKIGHVIFQVPAAIEAKRLEQDLWRQQQIKLTFNRPPSLGGMEPELDEAKNTGQLNMQPNDVAATMQRE